MATINVVNLLQGLEYPGRGIMVGHRLEDDAAIVAYFIMGRSENSRNRIFQEVPDGIITEPADPAKVKDPSLILYQPVRYTEDYMVISNGDQTDTITQALAAGGSFSDALLTRTFEPDAPNYTPRISAMVQKTPDGFTYQMSILKSADGDPAIAEKSFFHYGPLAPNNGRMLFTYAENSDPLKSFVGEPVHVPIYGVLPDIIDCIWDNLHPDHRISLWVCEWLKTGERRTMMYNKYQKI